MWIHISVDICICGYMYLLMTQRRKQSTPVLTRAALGMQELNMHMKTPLALMQVVLMHDKDAFTLTGTY